MIQMNLSMRQRQSRRHRQQTVVAKVRGETGRGWSRAEVSRCKLVHTGWISKKGLL